MRLTRAWISSSPNVDNSGLASRHVRSDARAERSRRHWANGSAPSLFELIADSYGALLPYRSVLRIRAAVVDADVLLKEIVAQVKRPGEIVLFSASRLGLLRIYVADTVPAEVDRNLERVCAETRRDYAAALAVWESWRPHLRVVATPDVLPAEVGEVEPSDVPTAVLALTLGREATWSNDRDLQRTGFARRYPLGAALAMRDVSSAEVNVHISLRISGGALEGTMELVRRAWLAAGPRGQLAVLGALGLLLGIGLARRREITAAISASAPQVLSAIAQSFEQARDWYSSELKKLPPAPVIDSSLPLDYLIARVLAYAPLPLTAPEIVSRLATLKVTVPLDIARMTLVRSRIFVPVGRWYWQLGL